MRKGPFSPENGLPLTGPHSFSRLGNIFPEEVDVILPFTSTFNLTSAATLYATKYLYTNAAYDVDPALGSTATAGFTEWSDFYSFYRVIGYEYELEVNNQNSIPMNFSVINSNNSLGLPSGIGVTTDLSVYSDNPHNQHTLLAHAYSSKGHHVFNKQLTIAQVVGSMAPETEDNYRAPTTTTPVDLTYLLMGVTSVAGGTNYVANNVNVVVHLRMLTRFYNRRQLSG